MQLSDILRQKEDVQTKLRAIQAQLKEGKEKLAEIKAAKGVKDIGYENCHIMHRVCREMCRILKVDYKYPAITPCVNGLFVALSPCPQICRGS